MGLGQTVTNKLQIEYTLTCSISRDDKKEINKVPVTCMTLPPHDPPPCPPAHHRRHHHHHS
jgi:hypothetical protein